MQGLSPLRVTDMSMMLPLASLHSEASSGASISTGKERDSASGLDYFGARYYSSNMGRFMSPDWSDVPVSVPYADLRDPQSLNLYAYVRNNPMTSVDLDGHLNCSDPASASGIGCQTQAAWKAMDNSQATSVADFMQQYAAHQQNGSTSSSSSGTLTDYVSVSDWPTGAGGFHHTGIAVDSDDTHGFSTLDPHTPWWKRLFGAPAGAMEDDIQHHTTNGEVVPHSYIHIPITAEQAAAMKTAIAGRTMNPGRYNLIFRNCAGAVESILHAGGVSGIPHSEVNIPFVLHDIMLRERGSQ